MWIAMIILEIVCAALLVGMLFIDYRSSRDLFSILFIIGITALSVPINIIRIDEYWAARRAAAAAAANSVPDLPPPLGWAQPPKVGSVRTFPPEVRPPTGAAAPPVVRNPYFPVR